MDWVCTVVLTCSCYVRRWVALCAAIQALSCTDRESSVPEHFGEACDSESDCPADMICVEQNAAYDDALVGHTSCAVPCEDGSDCDGHVFCGGCSVDEPGAEAPGYCVFGGCA